MTDPNTTDAPRWSEDTPIPDMPVPPAGTDFEPFPTGEPPTEVLSIRAADDHRDDCPTCRGTGKVRTITDLLRESLGTLGTNPEHHDRFVATFYSRLFKLAPQLAEGDLFPPDLTDVEAEPDGRGKAQRDRLLEALLALGSTYDPDDPKAMRKLDAKLEAFGRMHAAFRFPDGVRPPSLEEYALVKRVLFGMFTDPTWTRDWRPEYGPAWSEAYDYAYRRMADAAYEFLKEQGSVYPRSARR